MLDWLNNGKRKQGRLEICFWSRNYATGSCSDVIVSGKDMSKITLYMCVFATVFIGCFTWTRIITCRVLGSMKRKTRELFEEGVILETHVLWWWRGLLVVMGRISLSLDPLFLRPNDIITQHKWKWCAYSAWKPLGKSFSFLFWNWLRVYHLFGGTWSGITCGHTSLRGNLGNP